MQIETSLGNVKLNISGKAREDKREDIARAAAASLTYRAGASKAFGKKSGHNRDEAYSAALGQHVVAAVTSVLTGLFEDVKIEHSAYVKPVTGLAKAQADILRQAGVAEEKIRELVPAAFAAEPEAESEEALG